MLRNITKSIGLAKALINPSSASSLLKFNQIPVYHFGSQKPPKGKKMLRFTKSITRF